MQNKFKVNRPLLNVHRFEVRQFVRFWKLPIYSDQSNQKTNYLRNKIRKQLMPTLRIFFNPQIDSVLLNFVEIRNHEHSYFQNVLKFLLKPQECYPLFSFSLFSTFTPETGGRIPLGTPLPWIKVRGVAATSRLTTYGRAELECLLLDRRWSREGGHSTELLMEDSLTSSYTLPVTKHPTVRQFYLRSKHGTATTWNDSYKFNKLTCGAKLENNLINSFFTRPKINQRMLFSMQSSLQPNFYAKQAERKALILDPMWKGKALVRYLLVLHSRSKDGHFLLIPSYEKLPRAPASTKRFYAENTNKLYKTKKDHAKLRIQYKNHLNYLSRNQIVYWLIINNNLIKKLNCYPSIFQKQVLKTILKTFNKVENVVTTYSERTLPLNQAHTRTKIEDTICARGSKQINEKKLTPLLILKFTRKLFVLREKRFLLFTLRNLINKY